MQLKDKTGQEKTTYPGRQKRRQPQDKTRLHKTTLDNLKTQDTERQDKTRQDKTRQPTQDDKRQDRHKTKQDCTRHWKTRQDQSCTMCSRSKLVVDGSTLSCNRKDGTELLLSRLVSPRLLFSHILFCLLYLVVDLYRVLSCLVSSRLLFSRVLFYLLYLLTTTFERQKPAQKFPLLL